MPDAGQISFNPTQPGTYVWNGHAWVLVFQPVPTTTTTITLPAGGSIYRTAPPPAPPEPDPGPTEEEIAEAIESIKRALIARRAS